MPATTLSNEGDPSGLEQCPPGTNYDNVRTLLKYTCLSINYTELGKEIWIRQGSKRSFGLSHQSLPLDAVEQAIDFCLEEQGPGSS